MPAAVSSGSPSPFDLTGRGVVVTGGNGGIGLGMALGLARAGADVVVWGTRPEKNASALAAIEGTGARALAVVCDITDEAQVQDAFDRSVDFCGRVHACFANAGMLRTSTRFTDMTLDEWRGVLAVNLDGTFLVLRSASRHMVERGGGSLVVTSSISAIHGHPRGEHYATAKAGQTALVRSLAVELAPKGIRVNTLVPGWVDTELSQPVYGGGRFETGVQPRVPMKRAGVPEDFAGIAVYLASDASAYHTGDTIVVDGGYSIR